MNENSKQIVRMIVREWKDWFMPVTQEMKEGKICFAI